MRQRTIEILYGTEETAELIIKKKKLKLIINIAFPILCLIPIFVPSINIGVLMNIGGAVCAFFFVYAVPIALHL